MKKEEQKEYIIEYNMVVVNIIAIIFLFVPLVLLVPIYKLGWSSLVVEDYIAATSGFNLIIFIVLLFAWLILHEIIHSIAYVVGGAKWSDVVFGMSIENGVFYCKAKNYINKKCIMLSLLAPLTLIGIITYIIGLIISCPLLIILSIFNISGAGGDIMMFLFFLRQKDDVLFRELGFSSPAVVKTSEDISSKKYFGIKNIREVTNQEEVTEGEEKKVTISKASWVMLIVMVILLIVNYLMLKFLR